MCSNASQPEAANLVQIGLAARLAAAIDELAAVASCDNDADGALAERLAGTWAMIAAADPELAARVARYSRSRA
jgi:hypothetical protein